MSQELPAIYFDNNATTPAAPECLAEMAACLGLGPLNPSSKHALGERAKRILIQARARVADFLGTAPSEIVFTSGGTEANHLAILGALAANPLRSGIIASEVEHPSTLMLLRSLRSRGVPVGLVPVDREGRLNLAALEDSITEETAVVTLMWANNETGVLFPVREAAALAHSRGALFHTDAVQAAGKVPVDLASVPADLLSFSGHKLHAPAGTGGLFVRRGLNLPCLQHGSQERGRRGGTENVAAIAALGVACSLAGARLPLESRRVERLRDRLESGIREIHPGAHVNGGRAPRLPNTANIRFGEGSAEWILGRLDALGICASAGSACSAAGTKPSHVLTAMGLAPEAALGSIRFSLGRQNTDSEVDAVLAALPGILAEFADLPRPSGAEGTEDPAGRPAGAFRTGTPETAHPLAER